MRTSIRLIAFTALLALAVFTISALAQTLQLSTLQFLPGDDAARLAAFEQKEPVIAQGGDLYLAVWTDARTDGGRKSGSYYDGNGSEIYGARLDANGNLIDTTPIVISNEAADQSQPDLAWNGQNWLVIWSSQKPTQFYWSDEVMAARVTLQGHVLSRAENEKKVHGNKRRKTSGSRRRTNGLG